MNRRNALQFSALLAAAGIGACDTSKPTEASQAGAKLLTQLEINKTHSLALFLLLLNKYNRHTFFSGEPQLQPASPDNALSQINGTIYASTQKQFRKPDGSFDADLVAAFGAKMDSFRILMADTANQALGGTYTSPDDCPCAAGKCPIVSRLLPS